jgi:flavin reductase (DIM6/NTAB) family NADH-FMN oxidoreductase RutF
MSPEVPSGGADPAVFRRLMGRWATGVSVVTSHGPAGDVGLTVNAFLSVSLAPPTILISLSRDADSTPVIEATRAFAVNLLAFDQRDLSERFAQAVPPAAKFRDLPLERGATGVPLLAGTLGALEARVRSQLDSSDHRLFLGEVVSVRAGREVPPLLFFRSGYSASDGGPTVRLPDVARRE